VACSAKNDIVIAGYTSDLEKMLNSNAGLKSRFTQFFDFPDWESEDCVALFRLRASEKGFSLGDGVESKFREACITLKQWRGWGNGRDASKLFVAAARQRAQRVHDAPDPEKSLEVGAFRNPIETILKGPG
jgi:hypothetical protein